MSEADRTRGNYGRKLVAGAVLLVAVVAAAAANLYTDLAPSLTAAQRADLLSGVVTVVVVLVVGVVFLAASVGREALSALWVLAERSRRLERGEFDVPLETNRQDEFGEVYRALAELRSGFEGQVERADEAESRGQLFERRAAEWSARMEAAANGDYSQRLDENVDDPELAALARNFNRLMDRVERQRQNAD
ncbi:histidine kinase [Halobacteriales archaeon QH_1_68_42]|nr:MAG: histidine kinase [Halobacteriales archaeon QH_1_68_42]